MDHKGMMQGKEGTKSHLIATASLFESFTTRSLIYYLIKFLVSKIHY